MMKHMRKVFNKDTRTSSAEAVVVYFEFTRNSYMCPGKCRVLVFLLSALTNSPRDPQRISV